MRSSIPRRWCPVCETIRPTTITFARQRNEDGTRRATNAICDLGHEFDPYV